MEQYFHEQDFACIDSYFYYLGVKSDLQEVNEREGKNFIAHYLVRYG